MQTAPFQRRDGETLEQILSNQAGSESHDVSAYPASSALCPLTLDQNVSAFIQIDKGPAHHNPAPHGPLISAVRQAMRNNTGKASLGFDSWNSQARKTMVKSAATDSVHGQYSYHSRKSITMQAQRQRVEMSLVASFSIIDHHVDEFQAECDP